MPGAAFLKGSELTLRTIKSADYGFIHEHWNDPDIRYSTPMPTPISKDGIEYFVEETDDAVQFLPCHEGAPVGFVMLFNIQAEEDHGDLAYWIIPDERGNGYATEAADLCLKHAFDDRGLHRVVARVFENNDASIRVLEKLGFEREGFLREHSYVNGVHRNMHLYGILASER